MPVGNSKQQLVISTVIIVLMLDNADCQDSERVRDEVFWHEELMNVDIGLSEIDHFLLVLAQLKRKYEDASSASLSHKEPVDRNS